MIPRFEAGLRPPLQPRELTTGSIAAHPSRERNASRLVPFIATEVFRTGKEGLFAAVRSEVARAGMQIPETPIPHDANHIQAVAIASGNNKKTDDLLQQISNHQLRIERFPEADELHSKIEEIDAASKAIDAHNYIQLRMDEADVRRQIRTESYVVIANDQVNAAPTIVEHPVTHLPVVTFENLGKPKTDDPENPTEFVRSTLQHMVDLAERYDWETVPYIIKLATVIHNPLDPDHNAVSLQRSAVFLSVDGLKHVASDRFDEYVALVEKQAGHANGKSGVTDIAGGLEFRVLEQMGLVEFVSGTADEIKTEGFPPAQRPDAHDHAYNMALGTSDKELIRKYFTPPPVN